jgi:hypothetical protein
MENKKRGEWEGLETSQGGSQDKGKPKNNNNNE